MYNLKHSLFQKHNMETKLNKLEMEKIDLETQLRANITSLESQLTSLEEAKNHEKMAADSKIVCTSLSFLGFSFQSKICLY